MSYTQTNVHRTTGIVEVFDVEVYSETPERPAFYTRTIRVLGENGMHHDIVVFSDKPIMLKTVEKSK
tara:strand:+ start:2196 stop:2396 length:201 start_codon:yes stop_codon:yes gene_type:complete